MKSSVLKSAFLPCVPAYGLVALSLLTFSGCGSGDGDGLSNKAVSIDLVSPPCAEPGAVSGYIEGNGFGAKNVSITVGGIEAEVITATGHDASFVVPEGIPQGPIQVVVTNPGGRIASIDWVACLTDTEVARIEITPAAVVLTEQDETYQLTAQAYNAGDQAIDADFTWTSLDPADAEVGPMGLVTAMVPIGSAQITAQAHGVTSGPAVVMVARPAAGAVFVSDSQVVDGPTYDGAREDFGVGSLIQLMLEGIGAPKVGDIVLPQETLSVGGRVASVDETSPGVFLVSVEVIPLNDMYEEFAINERFRLPLDETMVTERVAELYDVEQKADGSFVFTRKPDAVLPKAAVGTRAVDVFECEYPAGVSFTLNVSPPSFTVDPDLDAIVEWDSSDTDHRIVLVGDLKAEFSTKLSLTVSVEASIVCKIDVFNIPGPRLGIPFLYAGAVFPVGVGVALSGKINLPLNLELGIKPSAQITAGVRCPAGEDDCDFFGSGDLSVSAPVITPSVDVVAGDYNLRFEPQMEAFVFADLRIGVDLFVAKVEWTTFTAKAGLVQTASLATLKTQFNNAAYASNYALDVEISASAGLDTKLFLDLLDVKASLLAIKFTEQYAQSPTLVEATVDVATYEQQDEVTFEVELNPSDVNYIPTVYNVDEVLIYELRELSSGTKVASEIASVTPAFDGQTDFVIPWTPITEGAIGDTFFAAVETGLLPPLPLDLGILELGKVVPPPPEMVCDDMVDNDEDDDIDCDDEDCTDDPACDEICDDMMDNDADDDIDCDDEECVDDPACAEMVCDDTVDNDEDGDTDCGDEDCVDDPACAEMVCDDMVDNDEDGDTDCDDSDCTADPACGAGGEIVFQSLRNGNNEIYVMRADGSGQERLTDDAGSDITPTWLPDGRIGFSSNRDGERDIWVMDAVRTDPEVPPVNLTDTNLSEESWPSWSRDGTRIVFDLVNSLGRQVYVMDADGSNRTNLSNDPTSATTASWSPDGTQIAFATARDGDFEIYVMDADGSNQVNLTTNAAADNSPTWSPDGTQIAFWSDRDGGNRDVYVMSAGGVNPQRLTDDPARDTSPTWSPDGTQIAFRSQRDGNSEIYVMNADGSSQVNLTNNPASDTNPRWAPLP